MLVFPLAFDQPHNAAAVDNRQLGVRMDIAHFTPNELVNNIEAILVNTVIQENVKRSSSILRDKLHSPGARASFWINHVTRNGGKHLRTSAFELNYFQFLMFDIYTFVFCIIMIILCIWASVLFCVIKCCIRCCFKPKVLFYVGESKLKSE